jgi:2-methylcitrate dehydratase
MTIVEQLADYCARASFDNLSSEAHTHLKIRILDSLGWALGALCAEPVNAIRGLVNEFEGAGPCTMIESGRSAPDRTAL